MPIETPSGVLEVENAKLRASSIEATIAVGIGTESNDAYPLQVFKETEPDIRIQEGSTISSASRIYSNNSNLYIQTGSNFTSGSSGDVAFQTMQGASTHMVIKSDGNVGIGTGSPNTLLELSKATGSATISPTELRLTTTTNAADWDTTNSWGRLAFYTNDVTGDAPGVMASVGAVASSVGGGENTRLAFFTAEPHLERMCVDRYGNVGIGTANPRSALDINSTGAMIIPSGTTAQQPGTAYAGMLRFNTSLNTLQVHNGTAWNTVGGVSATGGTVTTIGGYTIHTFTTSGDFDVVSGGDVEYLIVAGGGGGGSDAGGGGGAGGMLTGTYTGLSAGTYTITVGEGGTGATGGSRPSVPSDNATNGGDSVFHTITANGGGFGSIGQSRATESGNGGSGGGGGGSYPNSGEGAPGGTGISGQGYDGAVGLNLIETGGGGGGAGGSPPGSSRTTPAETGQDGGPGRISDITGTSTYYAGGGGGGGWTGGNYNDGAGGDGGGGDGGGYPGNSSGVGQDGTANTGGGGGGGNQANGGDGGSGIVIIRYLA